MLSMEIITAVGAILFVCMIKAAPIIIMLISITVVFHTISLRSTVCVSWVAVAGVAGMTIFTLTLYDLYQYKTIMCGQSVIATIIDDGEDKLKCAGGAALFTAALAAYASAFTLILTA